MHSWVYRHAEIINENSPKDRVVFVVFVFNECSIVVVVVVVTVIVAPLEQTLNEQYILHPNTHTHTHVSYLHISIIHICIGTQTFSTTHKRRHGNISQLLIEGSSNYIIDI